MSLTFEPVVGRLDKGDLIVIEISGKLVPKRPWDDSPQWFECQNSQVDGWAISLMAVEETEHLKPRKFIASGFSFGRSAHCV